MNEVEFINQQWEAVRGLRRSLRKTTNCLGGKYFSLSYLIYTERRSAQNAGSSKKGNKLGRFAAVGRYSAVSYELGHMQQYTSVAVTGQKGADNVEGKATPSSCINPILNIYFKGGGAGRKCPVFKKTLDAMKR